MNQDPILNPQSPARRPRRRKRLLVNPDFQWKFAGWIMLDVFVLCAAMGVVLYGVLAQHVRTQVINPKAHGFAESVAFILGFAAFFAAAAAAGFGLWSILVTHRLCGPIHVVGQHLQELIRGSIPKCRTLRRKDEFRAFYELFGRAMDTLRTRKAAELDTLNGIMEVIQAAGDSEAARRRALESVVDAVRVLRDAAATAVYGEKVSPPSSDDEDGFIVDEVDELEEPQSEASDAKRPALAASES